MQAATLQLQPRTTGLLDLSIADNIVQARHEFERARDFGNDADRAAWCLRWAPSALDVADDRDDEIKRLENDVSDLEQEVKDADEVDTSDLDAELSDASNHLSRARAAVASLMAEIDSQLDMAADAVGKAVKEANKL